MAISGILVLALAVIFGSHCQPSNPDERVVKEVKEKLKAAYFEFTSVEIGGDSTSRVVRVICKECKVEDPSPDDEVPVSLTLSSRVRPVKRPSGVGPSTSASTTLDRLSEERRAVHCCAHGRSTPLLSR